MLNTLKNFKFYKKSQSNLIIRNSPRKKNLFMDIKILSNKIEILFQKLSKKYQKTKI
jgi:hypothetical protein